MSVTLSRIFFAFAAIVGVASGIALVEISLVREARLPAYFIILIALAAFDVVCVLRGGEMITMTTRFVGFGIALAGMLLAPAIAGVEVRYF